MPGCSFILLFGKDEHLKVVVFFLLLFYKCTIIIIIMPFEEGMAYFFAAVRLSVSLSVGPPTASVHFLRRG